jgi:hypothetical protein
MRGAFLCAGLTIAAGTAFAVGEGGAALPSPMAYASAKRAILVLIFLCAKVFFLFLIVN